MFYQVLRLTVCVLLLGAFVRWTDGPAPAEAASGLRDEMQILDIGPLVALAATPDIYQYRLNNQCVRTEKSLFLRPGFSDTGVLLLSASGQYHLGVAGRPPARALLESCG